jgi:hypothetical protein
LTNKRAAVSVDLVRLEDLDAAFEKQKLKEAANDKPMDVSEMVMTLLPVFEAAQATYPELIRSLPLAIDLCINFLLNIYDPFVFAVHARNQMSETRPSLDCATALCASCPSKCRSSSCVGRSWRTSTSTCSSRSLPPTAPTRRS